MSITTTYNFDTPGNFALTQAQIEAATAKLAVTLDPGNVFNATLSGATLSSATEYLAPNIRQIDQTPATSVMGSGLTSQNLNWHKSGSTTGTLNGAPTFSGAGMATNGANGVFFTKVAAAAETIRFKWIPTFTGGPATNINLISGKNPSNNNDLFLLLYSPTGGNNLRLTLRDSAGVSIYSTQILGPLQSRLVRPMRSPWSSIPQLGPRGLLWTAR
ncbi:MAG: hypothetical protein HC883_02085 [Bdellovibrionaceae bacterium]|nr:hypothetical protein [Pseudobdellovibrionaceae bacterium]